VGQANNRPVSIHAIAVVGPEVSALILLETYRDQNRVGLEFLDALPSIELTAADAANVYRAEDGSPVDFSGRWISYEGSLSIQAQPEWNYAPSPFDDLGATANDATDFMGMWFPDGDEETASYVLILLGLHSTGIDAALADPTVPEVDERIVDAEGRVTVGMGAGESLRADGTRIAWRDTYVDARLGVITLQRIYFVELSPTSTAIAYASDPGPLSPTAIVNLEAALETLRAEPAP
jgi:hypothetical protein